MLAQTYVDMLSAKSVIRNLSEYATARGKEIGYENVFDYTLGNPSVPVPDAVNKTMIELLSTKSSIELHGYSQSLGIPEVRVKVAASLNRRFNMNYTMDHIFMTSGAAGAIAHAVRLVTVPGDEILTFAPFFPEYNPYVNLSGAVLKVVPADVKNFQINFEAFESMINEKTMAVLVNTPNNPSGICYSTNTIEKLASILKQKSEQYSHVIYLISDEPYREIVFEGVDAPFPSKFYDNSICCYSFSKSLSLPGERIGYMAVNPKAKDAEYLVAMAGQISRFTGHNCPSSIMQLAIEKVIDDTCDLSIYERNAELLYNALTKIGYEVVKPMGTFYMFPKSPIPDANEFCWKGAKELGLIIVPGDSFECPGYFRISYCVPTELIEKAIPLFEKLYNFYK